MREELPDLEHGRYKLVFLRSGKGVRYLLEVQYDRVRDGGVGEAEDGFYRSRGFGDPEISADSGVCRIQVRFDRLEIR